jgi:hypothetical protein
MVPLVLLALASTPPEPRPAAATVQATATIRILTAVRLTLGAPMNPDAPPLRDGVVRLTDGSLLPAKLIEFQ